MRRGVLLISSEMKRKNAGRSRREKHLTQEADAYLALAVWLVIITGVTRRVLFDVLVSKRLCLMQPKKSSCCGREHNTVSGVGVAAGPRSDKAADQETCERQAVMEIQF